MSYASLLINTGTVWRFTEGAADVYGNPAKTWAAVAALTDIACRWSTPKHTEVKVGAEVVIVEKQLFLTDIAITEQDRFVMDGNTYEILSVFNRQNGTGDHHKEAYLREVRTS